MSGAAWTSSVWGGAKTALIAANGSSKLGDGEEECMICRGDVPASVGFQPCEHKVCFACVENMRAKNIFKADKGVRCPFCRTFIEAYVPLRSSVPAALQEVLDEANKAATIAAAARDPERPSPSQPAPAAVATTDKDNWTCGHCNNVNLHWRDCCNRCGKPNPRPKPTPKAKDVLKCSPDEILAFVNEKLHPHINKAFLDAGCPYVQSKVTGTQEQVVAALKNKGEERLLRIVKVLSDAGHLPACAEHFFGNYTVQDLLEATAKLRAATQASYQFIFDAFKNSTGGLDPFGVLHSALVPVATRLATHAQGTYVVQKIVELCSANEMVAIAMELFKKGPIITSDSRGVHVMVKLVTQLSAQYSVERSDSIKAVAEQLCGEFLVHPAQMKFVAYHQYGGAVIWESLQVAIPRQQAVKLGAKLAAGSKDLISNKGAAIAVLNLLHLQALEPGSDEVLREFICVVAMNLQGHYVAFLMQEDGKGCELVQLLVQRLAEEQEIAWIDTIILELIASGDTLIHDDAAMEVLKFALSVNVFDLASARMHLDHLEHVLGDCSQIVEEVTRRIQANRPPPPPKYYAPCSVQPIVKQQPSPHYAAPKVHPKAGGRHAHDGAGRGRGRGGRANGTRHVVRQPHQLAAEHSVSSVAESLPSEVHASEHALLSPERSIAAESSVTSEGGSSSRPAFPVYIYDNFPPSPAASNGFPPSPEPVPIHQSPPHMVYQQPPQQPPQQHMEPRPQPQPQHVFAPPQFPYPMQMNAFPPSGPLPRQPYMPPGVPPLGPPRGYAPHMQSGPYMPHYQAMPPHTANGGFPNGAAPPFPHGPMRYLPNAGMPYPHPAANIPHPYPTAAMNSANPYPNAAASVGGPHPIAAANASNPYPTPGLPMAPGPSIEQQMNTVVITPTAPQPQAPAMPVARPAAAAAAAPQAARPAAPQQMAPPQAAATVPRPNGVSATQRAAPSASGQKSIDPWVCRICTYHHKLNEAEFLACAVCGSVKGVENA